MTTRMRLITFEKLIDLSVVIAGILIAVSMNTCMENRAYKKDWEEHRVLFVQSIEKTKVDYLENLKTIQGQIELGEKALLDAREKGKLKKENLNKFAATLGSLHIYSAVNEGLYKSFLSSKNPYFLKNFVQMVAFEEFFIFKESVMIVSDLYVQMILPDLFAFKRKTMDTSFLDSKRGRQELLLFLKFQKGFLGGLVKQYEGQIEKSEKLLNLLKN